MNPFFQVAVIASLIAPVCGCDSGQNVRSEKEAHERDDVAELLRVIAAQHEFFGNDDFKCSSRKLVKQGFGGYLDKYASVERMGLINAGGMKYHIYYYKRNEKYGNNAVVLLLNDCNYFGSYAVNNKTIQISGMDIVFDSEYAGRTIHFSGISPPARVLLDGEYSDITR